MSLSDIAFMITMVVGAGVLLALYFLPRIIAYRRGKPDAGWILGVNIFFGASGAGWVVALIWACSGPTHRPPAQRLDAEDWVALARRKMQR
ncbi:MAG TPA: superinfection immunity protein [Reyranella sp.]|jgi:hypothetical protein